MGSSCSARVDTADWRTNAAYPSSSTVNTFPIARPFVLPPGDNSSAGVAFASLAYTSSEHLREAFLEGTHQADASSTSHQSTHNTVVKEGSRRNSTTGTARLGESSLQSRDVLSGVSCPVRLLDADTTGDASSVTVGSQRSIPSRGSIPFVTSRRKVHLHLPQSTRGLPPVLETESLSGVDGSSNAYQWHIDESMGRVSPMAVRPGYQGPVFMDGCETPRDASGFSGPSLISPQADVPNLVLECPARMGWHLDLNPPSVRPCHLLPAEMLLN